MPTPSPLARFAMASVASRSVFRRLGRVGSQCTSSWSSVPTPVTYGTPTSTGTPEFDAVSEAATRIVVPDVAAHLRRHGYAVVDGALDGLIPGPKGSPPETLAETLRRELLILASTPGVMQPNSTVLVQPGGHQHRLEKRNVLEAEMHVLDTSVLASVPALRAVAEDRSCLTLLNVMLPSTSSQQLHHQVTKVQRNTGDGGCFPLHFDADPGVDARRITMLTYLNPTWRHGDGGELVLFPFPMEAPVSITPKMGRVVLFAAQNMLHRVTPSSMENRLCFTQWFFAKEKSALESDAERNDDAYEDDAGESLKSESDDDEDSNISGSSDSVSRKFSKAAWSQARELCRPHLRKHFSKVVFATRWAESIVESHPPSDARVSALSTHHLEVTQIMRALAGKFPEGVKLVAHVAENGTWEQKDRLGVKWL
jgi:hypothetical protein